MRLSWRALWFPWALGGYFVSLLGYNTVDRNMFLPLLDDPECIVSQLVSPGKGDLAAFGIGAIGPCVTAPVFEEVLYRGFLLPALVRFMPLRLALLVQAVLFGLHHQSLTGLVPLSVLGLIWGVVYVSAGNLLVPIVIHMMWNSRIFLSSLLS